MVLQVTIGLRELDETEENVLPYGAKTTTINLQKSNENLYKAV